MEDKDKPNIFSDKQRLFFAEIGDNLFKELPIVENSLLAATDEVNVREMIEVKPIDVERLIEGSYSFNLDNDSIDKAQIDKFLGIDVQLQIDNAVRSSVIIECGEYILRPKNLKYPNKKRARRIWKKWRKRYGVRPSKQVVIPQAVISFKPEIKDGCLYNNIEILAKKISD